MIDLAVVTRQMHASERAIGVLLADVPPAEAEWKPTPARWSLLEVACHLLDEERRDFRVRLDITLHRNGEPWPPIDPEGWVIAHDYAAQSLPGVLRDFAEERASSIAWLDGLDAPDWSTVHTHPRLGDMSAGDLLLSWWQHDALHLRQLAGLRYDYAAAHGGGFSGAYAGDW